MNVISRLMETPMVAVLRLCAAVAGWILWRHARRQTAAKRILTRSPITSSATKQFADLWRQSSLHERVAQACLVFGPSPRKPPVDVRRDG